jgi:hypothetical protein
MKWKFKSRLTGSDALVSQHIRCGMVSELLNGDKTQINTRTLFPGPFPWFDRMRDRRDGGLSVKCVNA